MRSVTLPPFVTIGTFETISGSLSYETQSILRFPYTPNKGAGAAGTLLREGLCLVVALCNKTEGFSPPSTTAHTKHSTQVDFHDSDHITCTHVPIWPTRTLVLGRRPKAPVSLLLLPSSLTGRSMRYTARLNHFAEDFLNEDLTSR